MRKTLCALFLLLIFSGLLQAEEEKKKIVEYPGVQINLEARTIRLKGIMSDELRWGTPLIEYIIMNGREKGYETLFFTEANPSHIHLGLVLLGLRPAPLPQILLDKPGRPEKYPDNMPPLVRIAVEWQQEDGTTATLPLEKIIRYRKDGTNPQSIEFAFTGSEFVKNIEGKTMLGAELSGDVTTLLYNPLSIMNLSYFELSPYLEEVSGFEVNIDTLPKELRTIRKMEIDGKGLVDMVVPKSTEVTIIIRPIEDK